MTLNCSDDIKLEKSFKHIFLYGLFLILPKKITKTYLMLSILAFIYNIRNKQFDCYNLDTDKLKYMLHVTLNNEVLLLPSFTYHWFWNQSLLNETIFTNNEDITIGQLLQSETLMLHHLNSFSNKLIEKIPPVLKFKLNLYNKSNKLVFKHDIIRATVYNF